jgi:hypothetical protein
LGWPFAARFRLVVGLARCRALSSRGWGWRLAARLRLVVGLAVCRARVSWSGGPFAGRLRLVGGLTFSDVFVRRIRAAIRVYSLDVRLAACA